MIYNNEIYTIKDFEKVKKFFNNEKFVKNNKKTSFFNCACSFDIETTSFYRYDNEVYTYNQISILNKKIRENAEKLSIMYIWQFGINGVCFVGREWNEFLTLLTLLKTELKLNTNKRMLIYVHNLAYEFQFLRGWLDWQKVFAIDERKPCYAITDGFEFRCSYLLSGYNLDTLAKNLLNPLHKIEKLKSLDYSLLRHSKTVLSNREMQYCINDIKIVMYYISEYIEKVGNIALIPLTKTAAVRIHTRKNCFYVLREKNLSYINLMKQLQINDLDELNSLQRAFCGGFTHANANYVNEIVENVASYDFTSSYPAVMIAEKYPMSKAYLTQPKNTKEFENYINNYCCVFDIEFLNIFSRETYENYISVSKCFVKENYSENNGRLICAKRICLTITEIDFLIIKNLYNFSEFHIGNMYVYKKAYLPTEFVKCILQLYSDKTQLKGIDGKENEYLNAKEMLNSCYGMSVTNPLHELIEYDNDNESWSLFELTDNEKEKKLQQYNRSKNRFLFYAWGVYVTAYARKNLFTAIFELKNDYIYSDTDSVKFVNLDLHKEYFNEYNTYVKYKLQNACKYHKIDFALCEPTNKKGDKKMLGVWDFEGIYEKFKTLGAKRYMIKKENALTVDNETFNYSLTVSGVNKKNAIPYLLKTYKDKIFEKFDNFLVIPSNATGKNIHTYIDYETHGIIKDYNGVENEFYEKSSIHLEPTEYTLNLSSQFLQYILKLKQ